MRIAMVTPRDGAGAPAIGRHVEQLARSMAATGHEVEVIALVPGPSSAVQRREALRGFDVVHAHGARTLGALLGARAQLPLVAVTTHLHRWEPARIRRVVDPVYRRLCAPALGRAEIVMCGSRAEAGRLAQLAPAATSRAHVVPEGIDVAAIRAAVPVERRRLGRLVLAAARSGTGVGAERLISALPALPDGFALAIPGDGPAIRALRAHAADLAVQRRVLFLGRLSEAAHHRWLRTADVVASMAEDAITAAGVLEARAAGAPVVASDVAVHREADELLGGALHLVSLQASPLALADVLAAVAAAPASGAGDVLPTWAAVAELTLALYARHLEVPGLAQPRAAVPWSVA